MRSRFAIVLFATAIILTGCTAAPTSMSTVAAKPTPTVSPTPTITLAAVSLATTCKLLLGNNSGGTMDGPLSKAVDIVTRFAANPDGSTITASEILSVIDGLKSADATAAPDLRPFIEAQISPLAVIEKSLTAGVNSTITFDNFRAAGIEIGNRCLTVM